MIRAPIHACKYSSRRVYLRPRRGRKKKQKTMRSDELATRSVSHNPSVNLHVWCGYASLHDAPIQEIAPRWSHGKTLPQLCQGGCKTNG